MYTHRIQSFDEIQCNKSLIDHTQIMHQFTHLKPDKRCILQHKKQSERVIELACHCNLKLELHCYKHL
ncbi:hypothetical protein AMTRI_Chr09g16400 [Amborella trichopoda]